MSYTQCAICSIDRIDRIDRSGSFEAELVQRVAVARDCTTLLNRKIRRSSISVSTKLRLYSVYVLLVFWYGAETWTMTKGNVSQGGCR